MRFWLVFGGVVLADQLTKSFFWQGETVNRGVAFGWWPADWWWLVGVGLVFLGFWWLAKESVATAVVLGGGVSNLVDRWRFGGVRDWFSFGFWPAFNLADLAVCLGVVWFLGKLIKEKDEKG